MVQLIRSDILEGLAKVPLDSLRALDGKTVLLTGGTGFLGKWILASLLYLREKDIQVKRINILTRSIESFLKSFPLANIPEMNFVEGDIRSFSFPKEPVDFVIHAAASSNLTDYQRHPQEMKSTIIEGTEHVWSLARSSGTSRLLYISSGAVYGDSLNQYSPTDEESPLNPGSEDLYGNAKIVSEKFLLRESQTSNCAVKIARCFAFAGPFLPLDQHFAAGNFMRDCLAGRNIRVKSSGLASRSYLHPLDFVACLWNILLDGGRSEIFNVGSEESMTIKGLAQTVADVWNEEKFFQQLSGRVSSAKIEVEILGKDSGYDKKNMYVPSMKKYCRHFSHHLFLGIRDTLKRSFQFEIDRRKALE